MSCIKIAEEPTSRECRSVQAVWFRAEIPRLSFGGSFVRILACEKIVGNSKNLCPQECVRIEDRVRSHACA
jgi:hypothetical protein